MEIQDNMRHLDVTLYGMNETLSPTLSKCRVRIFYKGLNRNRTYISEDFANQLIQSLPYTPIKGIFNKDDVDFEDHGWGHNIGQIYGVVPENPNFAWESHVDPDGVERVYACSDVILYTALYPEAKLIHEKAQSMEIHDQGLTGEWKIWPEDGQPYFDFQTGHLLGLQALGDAVEPCFEGSAFFSLYTEAKELYDYVRNFTKKEESKKMDKNIFKLSDETMVASLYDAINSEDSCKIICNVCDTYAVAYDAATNSYSRVNYSKNEAGEIIVGESEVCYMINVTESENAAISELMSVGSFAEIQTKIAEQATKIEEFEAIKADLEAKLTAANEALENYKKDDSKSNGDAEGDDGNKDDEDGKKSDDDKDDKDDDKKKNHSLDDETQAKIDAYEATIAEKDAEIVRLNQLNGDLNNEKSELESYKKAVDTEKKTAIIDEFSAHLSEEKIAEFKANMDTFSVDDFKKEVCFAAYNSDNTMFSTEKKDAEPDLIYKNTEKNTLTGALKLLNKHKGGNK